MAAMQKNTLKYSAVVFLGGASYGVMAATIKCALAEGFSWTQTAASQAFFGALQAGIWKYGLILGVFGLFVPVVLFGIGTPHLSAGLSTIMASSELPCGIAISVLVLSEPVDALQTAGIAVIMLGVAVSQLPNLLPQGASARFRKKRLQ